MKTKNREVIKVILADDHVLYRSAVKAAISSKKDIKVIAEADSGFHLLNVLKAVHPDVILMDLQMPVMDGIATLPEVKKLYPHIRVIMLSMVDDQRMISKLMELGANSYLIKTSDPEIIYEAIKTCYEQEFYFDSLTKRPLLYNVRRNIPASIEARQKNAILSEKEIAVLRLICEEKSTREIAEVVAVNPRIIEAIRNKLKTKSGTKSTAGLIMFAVKNKILDLDT
jgi:DNA-binding NarL/FixJ family response regulator